MQLMSLVDEDRSGSVSFAELTRGIKHVPLFIAVRSRRIPSLHESLCAWPGAAQ